MDVTNTGDRAGDDVAQLYIHDPVASISQPVRRLRGFQRVTLARASEDGQLHPRQGDFGFYDNRGRFVVEPGTIDVSRRQLDRDHEAVVQRARLLQRFPAGARPRGRAPVSPRLLIRDARWKTALAAAWTPSAIAQPATMSATKCSPP